MKKYLWVAVLALFFLVTHDAVFAQRPGGEKDFDGGLPPSVSACGTSPIVARGSNDTVGVITIGTGVVTACTITWASQRGAVPICFFQSTSNAVSLGFIQTRVSTILLFSAPLSGDKVNYFCLDD